MKLNNLMLSMTVAMIGLAPTVMANPNTGSAQVVHGSASFSTPDANTLIVNNSNGAIINWQDFSISQNELTHFQQSGANSSVLNQVVGNNLSAINGSLTSNGQVFLINQYGIVFGENAIINTAGFIASTLNLLNQDYLDGKFIFTADNAADILNNGFMTAGAAGDIALIAPNITNNGVINVEQGNVILAAGEKVTLSSTQSTDVVFEVQSADNSVTNLGSINTDGGAVAMFAGSLQHAGSIQATSLALDENGNVILVAKNNLSVSETATINADGEDSGGRVLIQNLEGTSYVSGDINAYGGRKGGVVDILGEQVALLDGATVNVNGEDGGAIHIGGNYQGQGPLQNASGSFIADSVNLKANANENGNGGEIIVWADNASRVYGQLEAKGGSISGDGGFIETSGKMFLDVTGIDLSVGSTDGANGQWLLDPYTINITTAGDTNINLTVPDFTANGNLSNISIDTLTNALNNNANVTISTAGAGSEAGDILWDANFNFTASNTSTLTLNADNNITLSGNSTISISNASDLTFNLNAANDIIIDSTITTADTSTFTLNAMADSDTDLAGSISVAGAITSNGGSVDLNAGSGVIFTDLASLNTGLGSIDVTSATGNISLQAVTSAASLTAANTINLKTAGALELQSVSGAASIDSNNNNITITANDVMINGTATINAGSAAVQITPENINNTISPTAYVSGLELDQITASSIRIGSPTHVGDINFSANNSTISNPNIILQTLGNISFNQTSGTALDVGTGSLTLIANQIIDLSVDLDLLAASIDLQTDNGAGAEFGGELDLQTNAISFNNSSTGSVALINNPTGAVTLTGVNNSADSGGIINIMSNSSSLAIGNISAGANGDVVINNGAGNIVISNASTLSLGANAIEHQITAGGSIDFAAASAVHNNNGTASIMFDAVDMDISNGIINAASGAVIINPVNTSDIGLGNATAVSAGLVLNDLELSNITAGKLEIGNTTITVLDIGANLNLGTLAYDLYLATGGALTFQPGSGIDAVGGNLGIFAPTLDFTTNSPVITASSGGTIELANISDANRLELINDCGATTAGMCISQANLDALTGFSEIKLKSELGSIDFNSALTFTTNVGMDTLSATDAVNFNGAVDFGANNVYVQSGGGAGTINFTIAAVSEITANTVTLNASTITNTASTVNDIVATNLSFNTDNGFGATATPFLTSVSQIVSGVNTNASNEIYINNDIDLYIQSLTQGNNPGLPITINNQGNLTIGTINGGDNSVILDTTIATNGGVGGSILDDTTSMPNITDAFRVELYSETGIGSSTDKIETNNINDGDVAGGGVFVSAVSSGDIYIDNVGGAGSTFDIQAVTSNATGQVFIHNANQIMNLNSAIVTTAGDITLESNSAINLNAAANAGSGNVNISVLSGTGDIAVNSGLLSNASVQLSNSVGGIVFGASGFVMSPLVNMNAFTFVDDSATTNAIGGGTQVNQLNVNAGTGINLTGAANDVDVLYLSSTTGNVSYLDLNDINLNQIITPANVSLTAGGLIIDANGVASNINAAAASVSAANGIGGGDAVETTLTTSLNFSNSSEGAVHFTDLSTNNLQVWGTNNTANTSTFDYTEVNSLNGSLTVPVSQALDSPNAKIFLTTENAGSSVTINGAVSTLGVVADLGVAITTDDIILNGTIDAGIGDLSIETFSNGSNISLGSNTGTMNISAAEFLAMSAGRLSVGYNDNAGSGTNQINIDASVDVSHIADTRFVAVGDITFNQGAVGGITANNLELWSDASIVDNSTGGFDVIATALAMVANTGIGSANAIDTQVTTLSVFNQVANHLDVFNSGALALTDSANAGGDLTIKSDNVLTLTNDVGYAGSTGASSTGKATLEGTLGVITQGKLTGASINISSENGVTISNDVIAAAGLVINGDTDNNSVGDVVIENTNGGVLNVSAQAMVINAGALNVLATSGATHVHSRSLLGVTTAADLTIMGGTVAASDAYLSSLGAANINIGGNLVLTGGSANNTAASIFDATNVTANNMNLTVTGNATLTGGVGDNSGAFIAAANLAMNVGGALSLTGGAGASSPSIIRSTSGLMSVRTLGSLSLVDGAGLGSGSRIISNGGAGFLDIQYLDCVGCGTRLIYSEKPVTTVISEIISTTNNLGLAPVISSTSSLAEDLPRPRRPGRKPSANNETTTEEDAEKTDEADRPKVLVCR